MRSTVEKRGGDVFRALADPTRRELLDLLIDGEQPVKSLAEQFGMSRPAISQHLRVLRHAGLVNERKVGRERCYRLCATQLREVSDWLRKYERFWGEKLDPLGEHLDEAP